MPEVLVQFDAPITGSDGRTYYARACGRSREDNLWEGWIEFVPTDGTTPLRSSRETTQPNRADLQYWATGLTRVYLEGALERALAPVRVVEPETPSFPAYEGPAPTIVPRAPAGVRQPILNPFTVFTQGEDVLRRKLEALDIFHLRNFVEGYSLLRAHSSTRHAMTKHELVEHIITAVRARVEHTPNARPESDTRPLEE
jgi:hypothetical protein